MDKLKIEKMFSGSKAFDTMKISGFKEGELEDLKFISNQKAKMELLSMLDERNAGIGTMWHNGNGVYGVWFDNEFAYINVGTSCD